MTLSLQKNGVSGFFVDSGRIEVTDDYNFVCNRDCGKEFSSTKDGIVFTLSKIVEGNSVTFRNLANDKQMEMRIRPFFKDGIRYKGHHLPGCDLVLKRESSKTGDYVKLASLSASEDINGVRSWEVIESRGYWYKDGNCNARREH